MVAMVLVLSGSWLGFASSTLSETAACIRAIWVAALLNVLNGALGLLFILATVTSRISMALMDLTVFGICDFFRAFIE